MNDRAWSYWKRTNNDFTFLIGLDTGEGRKKKQVLGLFSKKFLFFGCILPATSDEDTLVLAFGRERGGGGKGKEKKSKGILY